MRRSISIARGQSAAALLKEEARKPSYNQPLKVVFGRPDRPAKWMVFGRRYRKNVVCFSQLQTNAVSGQT
jgi:hypothetical protein